MDYMRLHDCIIKVGRRAGCSTHCRRKPTCRLRVGGDASRLIDQIARSATHCRGGCRGGCNGHNAMKNTRFFDEKDRSTPITRVRIHACHYCKAASSWPSYSDNYQPPRRRRNTYTERTDADHGVMCAKFEQKAESCG